MPRTHAASERTGLYRSTCACNAEVYRRKGEVFPPCLGCNVEVEWNLRQDFSILESDLDPKNQKSK